jgi:hypothetical protein
VQSVTGLVCVKNSIGLGSKVMKAENSMRAYSKMKGEKKKEDGVCKKESNQGSYTAGI